ncbi:MAG: PepSY-associated TM helix domain-containing protein, partial [Paludibacteraceae bacterium]|nr:PepSY-associated TM helix domain-containing protein [Paludibacteraceae bacterium]
HYYPNDSALKIFLKSGSNIVVNTHSGQVTYEKVRRRPVLGAMSRLHYNPGSAWTIFSDIFAISMLIVIITGLFMMKGKNGIIGIGGIELIIGIMLPVLLYLN